MTETQVRSEERACASVHLLGCVFVKRPLGGGGGGESNEQAVQTVSGLCMRAEETNGGGGRQEEGKSEMPC